MTEKKHLLRPLKGKPVNERHVILYMETDESRPIVTASYRRAWTVMNMQGQLRVFHPRAYTQPDELDELLHQITLIPGTVTIWLLRGWMDLVLSGLAQLVDAGRIEWRYCNLDGQRVLLRGLYRGRPVVITSLANWTGGRWDNWPAAVEDAAAQRFLASLGPLLPDNGPDLFPAEKLALGTFVALANTASMLRLDRLTPTVAGGALRLWRRWLGPRIQVGQKAAPKSRRRVAGKVVNVVIPVPYRPKTCQEAERHASYPLWSKQLRQGLVDEAVYVADLRAAYLLALLMTPLPARYHRTLHRPGVQELAERMCEHTGAALCQLQTHEASYPYRRGRRARPAVGLYWSWLAGAELVSALCAGHVCQVYTAYLWHSTGIAPRRAANVINFTEALQASNFAGSKAVWRALYSALIGQFAGRRRVWQDVPARPGFGRWAAWVRADCDTGAEVPYRAVAGRQQRLTELTDTSASVPLMYACITAQVRHMVGSFAGLAGWPDVVAVNADSVWLTQTGWQSLLRKASAVGGAPDSLRVKNVYDRVWMSGRSLCVVERQGKRFLRAPGVGEGALLDSADRYESAQALPWSEAESVAAASGVGQRRKRYPVAKLLEQYSAPARPLPLAETVNEPLLPAELLRALPTGRSVIDEGE